MNNLKKAKCNFQILFVTIIFALLLGTLNVQIPLVLAENVDAKTDIPILEITEGDTHHFVIDSTEKLSFKLSIKDPTPGQLLTWEILQQSIAGFSSIESLNDRAFISYLPSPVFTGDDQFVVQVEDDIGNFAQVFITVTVVSPQLEAKQNLSRLTDQYLRNKEISSILEEVPIPLSDQGQQGVSWSTNKLDDYVPPNLDWITENQIMERTGPTILVLLYEYEYIHGENWIPESTITLTIDNPANGVGIDYTDTETSDYSGSVFFPLSFPIEPGYVVILDDGINIKTHTVINFEFISFDELNDTLTGKANPGELTLKVCGQNGCEEQYPIASQEYIWRAYFSIVEIEPGISIEISQSDSDGDITYRVWNIPDPKIEVSPVDNTVSGNLWPLDSTVTLSIGNFQWVEESSDSNVWFNLYPLDLLPGQEIYVTDGKYSISYIVKLVEITSFNLESDYVFGVADPFSELSLSINNENIMVYADEFGNWEASIPGWDLKEGDFLEIRHIDNDENVTYYRRQIPNPSITVYPLLFEVSSCCWTPSSLISLQINDEVVSSIQADEEWGNAKFEDIPITLWQYDTIVVTDGTVTESYVPSNIAITEIDQTAKILRGTAEPDSNLILDGSDGTNWEYLEITTEPSGNWEAQIINIDLIPGASGQVKQFDATQRNATILDWKIPNTHIEVNPKKNTVHGYDWTPYELIRLEVNDVIVWTDTIDKHGEVYIDLIYKGIDIQPGDKVEMYEEYGINYKNHEVTNLTITEINQETNTIKGTAVPNSKITLAGYGEYAGWGEGDKITIFSDSTGKWEGQFYPLYLDLSPGDYGWVIEYDGEENGTIIDWKIPDPYLMVHLDMNSVTGFDWTPETMVTLKIDGETIKTSTSDQNGRVSFSNHPYEILPDHFEVLPGQTIELTDGIYTRTHLVTDISVSEVDVLNNTVRGNAEPGSILRINDGDNFDYDYFTEQKDILTDSLCQWEAKFDIELTPGKRGSVYHFDSKRNATVAHWFVPNPKIGVWPLEDGILAFQWHPNTTVSLSVNEIVWTGVSDDFGFIRFALSPFDVRPGQIIEISDGIETKYYKIPPLDITEVDQELDIVYGKGTPGKSGWLNASDFVTQSSERLEFIPDADGDWSLDFYELIDIGPGSRVSTQEVDSSGNYTVINLIIQNIKNIYLPLIIK